MTGHDGYLMQYDGMTHGEYMEMYLELEPELSVFEQAKNELEIGRLCENVEGIDDLKQEVQKLREAQAKSDKKILKIKVNEIIELDWDMKPAIMIGWIQKRF